MLNHSNVYMYVQIKRGSVTCKVFHFVPVKYKNSEYLRSAFHLEVCHNAVR